MKAIKGYGEINAEIYRSYINGNKRYAARKIKSIRKLQLALLINRYSDDKYFNIFVIKVLNGELYNV